MLDEPIPVNPAWLARQFERLYRACRQFDTPTAERVVDEVERHYRDIGREADADRLRKLLPKP